MDKVILFSMLVALFAIIVTGYDVGDPCVIEDPMNHGTYAPHPTNCSQFLQCSHGFFYERSCSEGLHWSAEEVACQWPDEAGCETYITENPPGTDDDVTTDTTTLSYPPSTDDDISTDTTSSYPPSTNDDETTTDATSTDETSTDETSTDETSTDETSTDETSTDETSTDETSTDETSTAEK